MGPMDALSALERSTDFAVADRSTLERLARRVHECVHAACRYS
jgi:hypothetical protein